MICFKLPGGKSKVHVNISELILYLTAILRNLLKKGRERRSSLQPLEYVSLENDTKIPVQSDRFWASANNKEILQSLSRVYLAQVAVDEGVHMVLSGYVSSSNDIVVCMKIENNGNNVQVNELNSFLEEADLRLIPHIHHAIIQGIQRVLVVSYDTDVFALVLYYTPEFVDLGAKEVWIMFGHRLLQSVVWCG